MKFQVRPVEVDAVQMPAYGDTGEVSAIAAWLISLGYAGAHDPDISEVPPEFILDGRILPEHGANYLVLDLPEGEVSVGLNDWIVRGANDEFLRMSDDAFRKTYIAVDEEDR